MKVRRLGQAAVVFASGYLAALTATRRWHQHWGASEQEITRPLPGDDLIPAARLDSTHAITIHAPADRIWPWLAQMGYEDRAGTYSYDLFEQSIGRNLDRVDPDIAPWCCGRSPPKARRSIPPGSGTTTMWPGVGRSSWNRSMRPRPGWWSGCGLATSPRPSGRHTCGWRSSQPTS